MHLKLSALSRPRVPKEHEATTSKHLCVAVVPGVFLHQHHRTEPVVLPAFNSSKEPSLERIAVCCLRRRPRSCWGSKQHESTIAVCRCSRCPCLEAAAAAVAATASARLLLVLPRLPMEQGAQQQDQQDHQATQHAARIRMGRTAHHLPGVKEPNHSQEGHPRR